MADPKSVVIRLTNEQRQAIKTATGQEISELKVEALEGRETPLTLRFMEHRKAPFGDEVARKAPFGDEVARKAPFGKGEEARKAPFGDEVARKAPFGDEVARKAPFGDEVARKAPLGIDDEGGETS